MNSQRRLSVTTTSLKMAGFDWKPCISWLQTKQEKKLHKESWDAIYLKHKKASISYSTLSVCFNTTYFTNLLLCWWPSKEIPGTHGGIINNNFFNGEVIWFTVFGPVLVKLWQLELPWCHQHCINLKIYMVYELFMSLIHKSFHTS